jgi:hypothetical protein
VESADFGIHGTVRKSKKNTVVLSVIVINPTRVWYSGIRMISAAAE